jgi:hypothetical protein
MHDGRVRSGRNQDASRALTIAQQEYLRIFVRVTKTRDDALSGLLLELPYRQVFTAEQCS